MLRWEAKFNRAEWANNAAQTSLCVMQNGERVCRRRGCCVREANMLKTCTAPCCRALSEAFAEDLDELLDLERLWTRAGGEAAGRRRLGPPVRLLQAAFEPLAARRLARRPQM